MKTSLLLIFLFLTNDAIFAIEDHSSWSDYQGKMNWNDAKAKCASIKMRLPSRSELESAYKSGLMASWKNDGTVYWSSEIYATAYAYFFYVSPLALTPSHSAVITFMKHVRCKSNR
jgi:hypothetical protein